MSLPNPTRTALDIDRIRTMKTDDGAALDAALKKIAALEKEIARLLREREVMRKAGYEAGRHVQLLEAENSRLQREVLMAKERKI